jgi:hypothetical protein
LSRREEWAELEQVIARLLATAEAGGLNEDDLNRISSIKGLTR